MTKSKSTKSKIQEAARKLFISKGLNGTTSREIAEQSGVNLALLNYHFKSKENLFRVIMMDTFQKFIGGVLVILENPNTTLETKVEGFVSSYIDLLLKEPQLPNFIIGEIRKSPDSFIEKIDSIQLIFKTTFFKQLKQRAVSLDLEKNSIHPLHFMMNMMSMTVMPFVARPIIQRIGDLPDNEFVQLMEERKKLIPMWIDMILTT